MIAWASFCLAWFTLFSWNHPMSTRTISAVWWDGLWYCFCDRTCVTLMFCVCFLSPSIDNYNLITTIDNYSMITSIDNYNTITTINKYNIVTTNNMILPEQLSHHLLRWHSRPRAEKNVVKTNLFRPYRTLPGLGAVIAQKSFTQKVVLIKYFFVWWFVTWDGFTKAPGFFSIASSLVPWWGAGSSSSSHKKTVGDIEYPEYHPWSLEGWQKHVNFIL